MKLSHLWIRILLAPILAAPAAWAYPTVPENPSVSSAWFTGSPSGSFTRYQWQSDPAALDSLAFLVRSLVYDATHLQCDLKPATSPFKFEEKSCSAQLVRCPRFAHQSSAFAAGNGNTTLKNNVALLLSGFSTFNYCGMGPLNAQGGPPDEAIWAMLGYLPSSVVESDVFKARFANLLQQRETYNGIPVPGRAYAVDTYAVLPRSVRRQAMGVMKQYLAESVGRGCQVYAEGKSNVDSVHDTVEPAYYYDCAYQSVLGDAASYQARDSGQPAFRNLLPYALSDAANIKIRKEGVESARRFSCVDRPYHPSRNPEDPGLIFFTGSNCSGDALIYVPFESETTDLWSPGQAFYRLRQPLTGATASPPVYETERYRDLTPAQLQEWSQILLPGNRAAQFPMLPVPQLQDATVAPGLANKLEAFSHFLEILDRKIYSIPEPGSGPTERRLAFRRTVRFKYRNHADISASESLTPINGQPYRAYFPGGAGGPFDPYFDDENRLETAGGSQPKSYLSEATPGNASTCQNMIAGDTSLHSVYPKNGVTPTRRGRFYYADLLPSDARRYAGRVLRQYRDISLIPVSQSDKKYSKVEKWEGLNWNREENPGDWDVFDRAASFPVTRSRPLTVQEANPVVNLVEDIPATSISNPSEICKRGQSALSRMRVGSCGAGGNLNLGGGVQLVGAMSCRVLQMSGPTPFLSLPRPIVEGDAGNLRMRSLAEGQIFATSWVKTPPTGSQQVSWIQVWSAATNTQLSSLPTTGGGTYTPVSAGIQNASVDCDEQGVVCTCGVRFKADVPVNPNWQIRCVPPPSIPDQNCRIHELRIENRTIVREQWKDDLPSDESGLVSGLFCKRGESLLSLGRNRSHFSGTPQRWVDATTFGPSSDDRPDHHACVRHLFPPVVSSQASRQVGPVGNPILALEAMGDGVAGGAMACSYDPISIRKLADFSSLPATLRMPISQVLFVAEPTGIRDPIAPWRLVIPSSTTWTSSTYARPSNLTLAAGLASLINGDPSHLIPSNVTVPQRGVALGLLNRHSAALDPGVGPEGEWYPAGAPATWITPAIPVNYGRCVQFKGLAQHPGVPLGPFALPLRNYLLEVLQLNLADDPGTLPNPARCSNVPWKPVSPAGAGGTGREAFKLE